MPSAPTILSQVKIAPPPPNFSGDLRAVFVLLETNLQVRNPAGYNTFVVGSDAPVSDSGPWLKDGIQWYIWDSTTFAYVPQILTDAFARDIPEGASLPVGPTSSKLFFLTFTGGSSGRLLFRWSGSAWILEGNLTGNTASRPAAPPSYSRYFDTTIGTELYFKPGFGWVTIAGIQGDTKFSTLATEALALQFNPGWEIYTPQKGRTTAGFNGAANGYTDRAVGDNFGAETHLLLLNESPKHTHKTTANAAQNGGDTTIWQNTPAVFNAATPNFSTSSEAGGDEAHNNVQPTLYLIPLRKVQ